MHLSPQVAALFKAAVHSKAVVLLLLIFLFIVAPIVCGGSVFGHCFGLLCST